MLQKIDSILQELCLLPSLSGHEQLVSNRMRECFQSYGLKVETDVLGNTITCIKGGDHTRRVMVSAHMDSPGLMVKTIDEDGFIHFERVGGIQRRRSLPFALLSSQKVATFRGSSASNRTI